MIKIDKMSYINTGYDRKTLYITANNLTPDEIAGASELDCELDLRGITGGGTYAIENYCTNLKVDRCKNCPLVNYNLDCHNNPIAK